MEPRANENPLILEEIHWLTSWVCLMPVELMVSRVAVAVDAPFEPL